VPKASISSPPALGTKHEARGVTGVTMQNVENLRVYKDAKELTRIMYRAVKGSGVLFKLQDQLLGSMGSVAANLAEFSAMTNDNQKKQKLITCIGECEEALFWWDIVSEDLVTKEKADEMAKQLTGLKVSLLALYKTLGTGHEARGV